MLNRYEIIGFLLMVLGFFLSIIIIGIPIMLLGWFVMIYGLIWRILGFIPGGRQYPAKLKQLFIQWYSPYFRKKV